MDDLIDRHATIDAVQGIGRLATLPDNDAVIRMSAVEYVLFNLPSVQPDLQPTCNQVATDCISRQAAIDALSHMIDTDGFRDGWAVSRANVDCMLKSLPSAQPEPKWIPCSERLPEKEGWYITTVESEKTGKRRIENDLFAIDIALAHGHIPNKFCKDGYRQRTVAWCEFPEPWRGGT